MSGVRLWQPNGLQFICKESLERMRRLLQVETI